tara:strand:+ start:297 stop:854 length:558 start_codon:yes stop_codon:yes gene_type:complete
MADGTLKVGTIITSSGSGTITLGQSGETVTVPNGALSGQSYPAFRAYRASSQSISDNVSTKVQIDTEDFDTDNCYDNSTNYRFTPTKAGKYFVYAQVNCSSSTGEDIHFAVALIKKNGSEIVRNNVDPHNGSKANQTYNYFATVVDMNGSSDYLELFGQVDTSSGTPSFGDGTNQTYFGAYRIGA